MTDQSKSTQARQSPTMWQAIKRGLCLKCPNCGIGSYRVGYLTVVQSCAHCGQSLGHIRADDGPAYITIVIVGHIVVALALTLEQKFQPPVLPHVIGALALTIFLVWALLPPIKGAFLAVMWKMKMRGDEH